MVGLAKIRAVSIAMRQILAVSLGLARAWRCELTGRSRPMCDRFDWLGFIMDFTSLMPNKSLEPTAVGAVSSAVAVHVASRRWLSFLR